MRAPAVSFAKRFAAALMVALLTFALLPINALAEGEDDTVDAPTRESQEANSDQADEAAGTSTEINDSTSAVFSTEAGTLAASLLGRPASFVNADVAFDGEPIIGSFTVDGLTFATNSDDLTLVAVSSDWQQVTSSQEGESSGVALMLASELDGPGANGSALLLPEAVSYNGVDYSVTSIGAYAFYLSGVTSVELPASIVDVDDRAFRSSDVASVEVAEGNPSYSSFDGALYDAEQLSLLLIPEGKQGTVLLPKTAESAAPSVFSHCPLVTQISVEEGSAAFASENGLLYDASLTTLLRVPAGATEITIREGCTTIAAGAMEACASLATINAPASVTFISPDAFTAIPTVSLLAASLVGAGESGTEEEPSSQDIAPQLTAMVALSLTDDDLPDVDCSRITVRLMPEGSADEWERTGFTIAADEAVQLLDEGGEFDAPIVEDSLQSAETYGANTFTIRNCMELESSDLFYYITIGAISTSANTVTLGGSAGSNHFNNMLFGTDVNTQWSMYNTPYGMAVVRSDGKGFLLAKSPFNSSYPTSFTSASTYLSYYTPWECAYYVKKDGTVVKQPGNYQTFYWNQVSEVYMTPGPSILETYHYNDGTGRTYQRWMAPAYRWTSVFSISRTGYTSQGWWTSATGGDKFADMGGSTTTIYKGVTARTTRNYYAHWSANSYTVEYWNKAGTTKLSSDANFKYDTSRTLAARPSSGVSAGYTAVGWATSANQSTATYGFSTSQKNLATSGTKKLYLAETANRYTISFNANWGSGGQTAQVDATYGSAMPGITSTKPTRQGYSFLGWYDTRASSGGTQYYTADGRSARNWNKTSAATLYARWSPIKGTVAYKPGAGATTAVDTYYRTWPAGGGALSNKLEGNEAFVGDRSLSAFYVWPDSGGDGFVQIWYEEWIDATNRCVRYVDYHPAKPGYRVSGWKFNGQLRAGGDGMFVDGVGSIAVEPVWEPIISAVVPLEATARVDLLGIEEQQDASAYIESRCGEPLTVNEIALTPLEGAREMFSEYYLGEGGVRFEALVGQGVSWEEGPAFWFSLDEPQTLEPNDPSASDFAFRMASYGSRVPIAYRFDIPDELLPDLVETTKPVCSVAYTVALASK